jgi:hypothetical protein
MSEILDKLMLQTNFGKVNWNPTAERGTFLTSFGDYSAVISKSQFTLDIELRFLDKRGNAIDAVTSSQDQRGNKTRVQLYEIYEAASKQAVDAANHLDNLARAIDAAGLN